MVTSRASPRFAVPVFPARLRLPDRRPGLIERPALVARLRESSAPLLAFVAPAGFGKTSLLSEWAAHDRRSFAALVMDSHISGPSTFLTYLTHALADVVSLDPRVLIWLEVPSSPQRRMALASLASSISDAKDPFVLVLDDAQWLQEDETVDVVTTLVQHVPEGSQVVLASRSTPKLPMSSLRALGLVSDLGPDDVRMRPSDVRAALHVNGVDLAPEDARRVAETTEGWPVAVYLAARAILAGAVPAGFSGRDGLVLDYLRSQFLSRQPDEVARFLRLTSVLEEMSGPLCDAALDREGSADLLEDVARSNLLLVPLDRERRWYRYHHLLQEALRLECELREPALLPAINLRASRWCEGSGDVEQAIRYAQVAEDVGRVRELVTRYGMGLFATGRDDALRSWFDWLATRGSTDGTVAVMCAWLDLLGGHSAEAERLVELAEAGDTNALLPEGSPVAGWTHALRGAMARDVASMRREATLALSLVAPGSPLRATVVTTLGFADYLDGALERADQQLADAVEVAVSLRASGAGILATAGRAAIALETGRWSDASSLADEGSRLIDRANLGGYVGACLLHAVRARVELHGGDVASAKAAMRDAEQLTPFLTARLAPLTVVARVELTRAYLELDDLPEAARSLGALESTLMYAPGLDPATPSIGSLRPRLNAARSRLSSASRLSPAELRLLPWLATQFSMREIAEHLFVSVHTVKAQVTSVYRKLGVSSRSQAVEQARGQGLLED